MMGLGFEEAKRLTYWEYTALLAVWNSRHQSEDDEPVELPDLDFVRRRGEMLEAHGIANGSVH